MKKNINFYEKNVNLAKNITFSVEFVIEFSPNIATHQFLKND